MNASRSTPPQTLAQKLIAAACGQSHVEPGQIVTCQVDLAMFHDSSGPRRLKPMLESLGAEPWDRNRIVLVLDHYLPASNPESEQIVHIARDWARAQRLPHVHDGIGICHVVLPQQGHIRPGMFCVGGDSHSPTAGAFGTYMFGIGSTEMLGVLVTGQIWLQVPHTLEMHWHGQLAPGVHAKDMILAMLARFGMNGGAYQAVEFSGSAVTALGMAERMTLSNMSAEMGAQVGLIAPDDTTVAWLQGVGVSVADVSHWHTDEAAPRTRHTFDASRLEPMVALPHSPANAHVIGQVERDAIDIAYIGACTGAKLEDLQAAAHILRGRRVASQTQLLVAPASQHDMQRAHDDGTAQALTAAGAQWLPTTCGACAGYGSALGNGKTVLSSTARNFRGRMGGPETRVLLASPATVAASAIQGRLTDPREFT